jgi:hypothetical protein
MSSVDQNLPEGNPPPKRRPGPIKRYFLWVIAFLGLTPSLSEWEEELKNPPPPQDDAKK